MQFTCWSEAFWPRRVLSKLLKQNPEWLVSEARPAVNQTAVTVTVAPSKIHSLWKLAGDETKRVCKRLNQQCLKTRFILLNSEESTTTTRILPASHYSSKDTQRHTQTSSPPP